MLLGITAKSNYWKLFGALILFFILSAPAFAQLTVFEGSLGPGDTKLGRYFDTYTLELEAGERVILSLKSTDFDSYLYVESPDGMEIENDDYGEEQDSLLDFIIPTSGEWRIKVSSYEDGARGDYKLAIMRDSIGELNNYSGALEEGDTVSLKGEYYDTYSFMADANQRIVVSLTSAEFDTFLVVQPPSGRPRINDDYNTEDESRLDFIAEEEGLYQVHVTSYQMSERGRYGLSIVKGGRADVRTHRGELDSDDPVLEEHGAFDTYPLELEAGRHVIVELTSEEFDTFLLIEHPDRSYDENDDYGELTFISRLELFAEEDGEYTIKVSSYGEGESGSYLLKIYVLDGRSNTATIWLFPVDITRRAGGKNAPDLLGPCLSGSGT